MQKGNNIKFLEDFNEDIHKKIEDIIKDIKKLARDPRIAYYATKSDPFGYRSKDVIQPVIYTNRSSKTTSIKFEFNVDYKGSCQKFKDEVIKIIKDNELWKYLDVKDSGYRASAVTISYPNIISDDTYNNLPNRNKRLDKEKEEELKDIQRELMKDEAESLQLEKRFDYKKIIKNANLTDDQTEAFIKADRFLGVYTYLDTWDFKEFYLSIVFRVDLLSNEDLIVSKDSFSKILKESVKIVKKHIEEIPSIYLKDIRIETKELAKNNIPAIVKVYLITSPSIEDYLKLQVKDKYEAKKLEIEDKYNKLRDQLNN